MKPTILPPDEMCRLQALRELNILDTLPEESFERLTRLARCFFEVPMALISLVDEERQWFKSHQGLNLSETHRDISFCSHAILSAQIMCVPDTFNDSRFADNPMVRDEPYLRFYAGAPLHTLNGSRVGTLCILDTRPRTFSSGDLCMLRDLADCAETDLQRHPLNEATAEAALLAMVAEYTGHGVVITDAQGQIEWVNSGFTHITGYTATEVKGLKPGALLRGPDTDLGTVALIHEKLKLAESVQVEILNYHKSGRPYWINLNIQPVYNAARQLCQLISIESDITKRKQAEQALQQSQAEAIRANQVKSIYLANMSHEIRTPLNSVIGFTELLLTSPLNTLQKQYVHNANVSGKTLLGLVDDILDLAKIEAGKLELETVPAHLLELLDQVLDMVKYTASAKGLRLIADIPPDLPTQVYLDPLRLKQVLLNLLNNAIKFTACGEVVLVLNWQAAGSAALNLSLCVRDTGIGIQQADQARLFQAFSQVNSSNNPQPGGTGLGLRISSLLVEKMGGQIQVKSQTGKGSHFCVRLKLQREPDAVEMPVLRYRQILIAGAAARQQFLLQRQLTHWRIQSQSMSLEIFRSAALCDWDAIILDLSEPQIPQALLQASIAHTCTEAPHLPVLLIHSAAVDPNLMQSVQALHQSCHLLSPFSSLVLERALIQLANALDSTEPEQALQLQMSLTSVPLRVLLVEDMPMNLLLLETMLKNLLPDACVFTAKNGREAINIFKTEKLDLVLMDIQMPEMDGLEASHQIRSWEHSQASASPVPIIALTADAFKEHQQKALAAGMDNVLTKPLALNQLRKLLGQYTSLASQTL